MALNLKTLGLGALLATASAAHPSAAQRPAFDLSQLDPVAAASVGSDLLRRAPDAAIDELFQAVHASAQAPQDAAVLCALFEPDADRSAPALQRAVDRLGPASRERFADALIRIALAGWQGQPQPYDPAAAQQALKVAAVKATFLHDGFSAGLTADGTDAASRDARCRSFRQLVGVLGNEPLPARAAATRWLLDQGLTLAVTAG
ncbi:hypothetical protein BH23PSE2_BH23PSE2_10190 [soil metagenome]